MICELCGGNAPYLKDVIIEGTRLMVCPGCAPMGTRYKDEKKEVPTTIIEERLQKRSQKAKPRDIYQDMYETLAEDYSVRIMRARQKKGLTQEELGKMINEKASVIAKLEGGSLHPDDRLRKKIEKFLNINLLTKETIGTLARHHHHKGLTLGDIIIMEKDKKK